MLQCNKRRGLITPCRSLQQQHFRNADPPGMQKLQALDRDI
jgi:hypothetical protein